MNEPAAFAIGTQSSVPAQVEHAMEGRGGRHQEAHNVYALQMARAAREALEEQRPDNRPFLFSRSGWSGIQRYAWTWTGDTESTWAMLRRTVATLLNLGLSGLPYTGSDIGGFSGGPSPELYVRWFELGAVSPLFRTHCSFDSPPRSSWEVAPDHVDDLRELLRLRYRLILPLPWARSTCAPGRRSCVRCGGPTATRAGRRGRRLPPRGVPVGGPGAERGRHQSSRPASRRHLDRVVGGAEVEGGRTVTIDAPLGRPVLLRRPGSDTLDQART